MNQESDFRLDIDRAFYIEDGVQHGININYLDVYRDGNIYTKGKDTWGKFEVNGKYKNGYVTFEKYYYEKHTVYYIGKFFRNKINLYYYSEPNDYYFAKDNLDKNNFNAEISFRNSYLAFPEFEQKHIFFIDENIYSQNEVSGIMFAYDGVFDISLINLESPLKFGFDQAYYNPYDRFCLLKIYDFEGKEECNKRIQINQLDNLVTKVEEYYGST